MERRVARKAVLTTIATRTRACSDSSRISSTQPTTQQTASKQAGIAHSRRVVATLRRGKGGKALAEQGQVVPVSVNFLHISTGSHQNAFNL